MISVRTAINKFCLGNVAVLTFIIRDLTMLYFTFMFSVKITGKARTKYVKIKWSLQFCHGLLCLSPSVNLTHLEQRRICCPLTKHRMSTGVNCWFISPNIMASSSRINCSTTLLFFSHCRPTGKPDRAKDFFFSKTQLLS